MSSFGSSVINKSNKRLAPKAPAQRKRPNVAPPSQASSTVGSVQQSSTDTPVVTTSEDNGTTLEGQQRHRFEGLQEVTHGTDRPSKRRRVGDSSSHEAGVVNVATRNATPEPTTDLPLVSARLETLSPEENVISNNALNPPAKSIDPNASTTVDARLDHAISLDQLVVSNSATEDILIQAKQPGSGAVETLSETQPSESTAVGVSTQQTAEEVERDGDEVEQHVGPPQANLESLSTQGATAVEGSTNIDEAGPHSTFDSQSSNPPSTQPQAEIPVEVSQRQVTPPAVRSPQSNHRRPRGCGAASQDNLADNPSTNPELSVPAPKKVRKPRKKAGQAGITNGASENQTGTNPTSKKPRRSRKKASAAAVVDEMQSVIQDTEELPAPTNDGEGQVAADEAETEETEQRRRGRKRAVTPDGAEDVEIATDKVTMFDLCKDKRRGKKSQREAEFQNIDWTEVVKRRKQAEAQARAGQRDQERKEQERPETTEDQRRGGPRGPQLKIVNGQVVLDADSLVVNRNAGIGQGSEEAIEESDLTKRINSQSWMYDNRRDPDDRYRSSAKSDPWTVAQTNAFYDALRMFGTDFFIISKMFPGKTRRHIKLKFVREERADPARVKAALIGEVVPMDLDVYCAATGQEAGEFKDPAVLEEELREQDEAQRREIEKQKEEQVEAARKKQEAAKARAEGKKGKKGQGRKGKRGAAGAGAEDGDGGAVAAEA